jgi:DNA-directed RNA polymerase subunit RPC12/RpoP
MSEAKEKGRLVRCPHCQKQIGTSPDGRSMIAGKGAVLPGESASLQLNEGVIVEPEGGGPLWVGCASCWKAFTLKDALQAEGH